MFKRTQNRVPSWFRLLSWIVTVSFAINTLTADLTPAFAMGEPQSVLMAPAGSLIPSSSIVSLPILKAIAIDPKDPFKLNFVLDSADQNPGLKPSAAQLNLLIKYFLSFLTLPEQELWVNLSPYEKDRIIAPEFERTNAGRDMLVEDYTLKQLASSLTYPDHDLGRIFWKKVFNLAKTRYGTTDIPVSTFNKVWVVPDKAVVYEDKGAALIGQSRLKVLVDEDYLSMFKHKAAQKGLDSIGVEITREIIVPELEREVNEGKYFAPLRQMYHSLILAIWFKNRLQHNLINEVYSNQKKTSGLVLNEIKIKEKIYAQYLKAFKRGVYNYIKEEYDPATQETIPRKYFSGGFSFANTAMSVRFLPASALGNLGMMDQIKAMGSALNRFTVKLIPRGVSKETLKASSSASSDKRGWFRGLLLAFAVVAAIAGYSPSAMAWHEIPTSAPNEIAGVVDEGDQIGYILQRYEKTRPLFGTHGVVAQEAPYVMKNSNPNVTDMDKIYVGQVFRFLKPETIASTQSHEISPEPVRSLNEPAPARAAIDVRISPHAINTTSLASPRVVHPQATTPAISFNNTDIGQFLLGNGQTATAQDGLFTQAFPLLAGSPKASIEASIPPAMPRSAGGSGGPAGGPPDERKAPARTITAARLPVVAPLGNSVGTATGTLSTGTSNAVDNLSTAFSSTSTTSSVPTSNGIVANYPFKTTIGFEARRDKDGKSEKGLFWRSPVSGTVVKKNLEPGKTYPAGTELADIINEDIQTQIYSATEELRDLEGRLAHGKADSFRDTSIADYNNRIIELKARLAELRSKLLVGKIIAPFEMTILSGGQASNHVNVNDDLFPYLSSQIVYFNITPDATFNPNAITGIQIGDAKAVAVLKIEPVLDPADGKSKSLRITVRTDRPVAHGEAAINITTANDPSTQKLIGIEGIAQTLTTADPTRQTLDIHPTLPGHYRSNVVEGQAVTRGQVLAIGDNKEIIDLYNYYQDQLETYSKVLQNKDIFDDRRRSAEAGQAKVIGLLKSLIERYPKMFVLAPESGFVQEIALDASNADANTVLMKLSTSTVMLSNILVDRTVHDGDTIVFKTQFGDLLPGTVQTGGDTQSSPTVNLPNSHHVVVRVWDPEGRLRGNQYGWVMWTQNTKDPKVLEAISQIDAKEIKPGQAGGPPTPEEFAKIMPAAQEKHVTVHVQAPAMPPVFIPGTGGQSSGGTISGMDFSNLIAQVDANPLTTGIESKIYQQALDQRALLDAWEAKIQVGGFMTNGQLLPAVGVSAGYGNMVSGSLQSGGAFGLADIGRQFFGSLIGNLTGLVNGQYKLDRQHADQVALNTHDQMLDVQLEKETDAIIVAARLAALEQDIAFIQGQLASAGNIEGTGYRRAIGGDESSSGQFGVSMTYQALQAKLPRLQTDRDVLARRLQVLTNGRIDTSKPVSVNLSPGSATEIDPNQATQMLQRAATYNFKIRIAQGLLAANGYMVDSKDAEGIQLNIGTEYLSSDLTDPQLNPSTIRTAMSAVTKGTAVFTGLTIPIYDGKKEINLRILHAEEDKLKSALQATQAIVEEQVTNNIARINSLISQEIPRQEEIVRTAYAHIGASPTSSEKMSATQDYFSQQQILNDLISQRIQAWARLRALGAVDANGPLMQGNGSGPTASAGHYVTPRAPSITLDDVEVYEPAPHLDANALKLDNVRPLATGALRPGQMTYPQGVAGLKMFIESSTGAGTSSAVDVLTGLLINKDTDVPTRATLLELMEKYYKDGEGLEAIQKIMTQTPHADVIWGLYKILLEGSEQNLNVYIQKVQEALDNPKQQNPVLAALSLQSFADAIASDPKIVNPKLVHEFASNSDKVLMTFLLREDDSSVAKNRLLQYLQPEDLARIHQQLEHYIEKHGSDANIKKFTDLKKLVHDHILRRMLISNIPQVFHSGDFEKLSGMLIGKGEIREGQRIPATANEIIYFLNNSPQWQEMALKAGYITNQDLLERANADVEDLLKANDVQVSNEADLFYASVIQAQAQENGLDYFRTLSVEEGRPAYIAQLVKTKSIAELARILADPTIDISSRSKALEGLRGIEGGQGGLAVLNVYANAQNDPDLDKMIKPSEWENFVKQQIKARDKILQESPNSTEQDPLFNSMRVALRKMVGNDIHSAKGESLLDLRLATFSDVELHNADDPRGPVPIQERIQLQKIKRELIVHLQDANNRWLSFLPGTWGGFSSQEVTVLDRILGKIDATTSPKEIIRMIEHERQSATDAHVSSLLKNLLAKDDPTTIVIQNNDQYVPWYPWTKLLSNNIIYVALGAVVVLPVIYEWSKMLWGFIKKPSRKPSTVRGRMRRLSEMHISQPAHAGGDRSMLSLLSFAGVFGVAVLAAVVGFNRLVKKPITIQERRAALRQRVKTLAPEMINDYPNKKKRPGRSRDRAMNSSDSPQLNEMISIEDTRLKGSGRIAFASWRQKVQRWIDGNARNVEEIMEDLNTIHLNAYEIIKKYHYKEELMHCQEGESGEYFDVMTQFKFLGYDTLDNLIILRDFFKERNLLSPYQEKRMQSYIDDLYEMMEYASLFTMVLESRHSIEIAMSEKESDQRGLWAKFYNGAFLAGIFVKRQWTKGRKEIAQELPLLLAKAEVLMPGVHKDRQKIVELSLVKLDNVIANAITEYQGGSSYSKREQRKRRQFSKSTSWIGSVIGSIGSFVSLLVYAKFHWRVAQRKPVLEMDSVIEELRELIGAREPMLEANQQIDKKISLEQMEAQRDISINVSKKERNERNVHLARMEGDEALKKEMASPKVNSIILVATKFNHADKLEAYRQRIQALFPDKKIVIMYSSLEGSGNAQLGTMLRIKNELELGLGPQRAEIQHGKSMLYLFVPPDIIVNHPEVADWSIVDAIREAQKSPGRVMTRYVRDPNFGPAFAAPKEGVGVRTAWESGRNLDKLGWPNVDPETGRITAILEKEEYEGLPASTNGGSSIKPGMHNSEYFKSSLENIDLSQFEPLGPEGKIFLRNALSGDNSLLLKVSDTQVRLRVGLNNHIISRIRNFVEDEDQFRKIMRIMEKSQTDSEQYIDLKQFIVLSGGISLSPKAVEVWEEIGERLHTQLSGELATLFPGRSLSEATIVHMTADLLNPIIKILEFSQLSALEKHDEIEKYIARRIRLPDLLGYVEGMPGNVEENRDKLHKVIRKIYSEIEQVLFTSPIDQQRFLTLDPDDQSRGEKILDMLIRAGIVERVSADQVRLIADINLDTREKIERIAKSYAYKVLQILRRTFPIYPQLVYPNGTMFFHLVNEQYRPFLKTKFSSIANRKEILRSLYERKIIRNVSSAEAIVIANLSEKRDEIEAIAGSSFDKVWKVLQQSQEINLFKETMEATGGSDFFGPLRSGRPPAMVDASQVSVSQHGKFTTPGGIDFSSTRETVQFKNNQHVNNEDFAQAALKSFQGFDFKIVEYEPVANPIALFLGSSIDQKGTWFSNNEIPSENPVLPALIRTDNNPSF